MNDRIQRAMELVDGLRGYSREVRDYLDKLDGRYVRPAQQQPMAIRLFRFIDRPYGMTIGRDVDAHMSIRIRHYLALQQYDALRSTYPFLEGCSTNDVVTRFSTWRTTISHSYTYEFLSLAVGHVAAIGLGVSVCGRWWTAARWFGGTIVGAALFGLYNVCVNYPRLSTYELYCAIEKLITRIKQSSCDKVETNLNS